MLVESTEIRVCCRVGSCMIPSNNNKCSIYENRDSWKHYIWSQLIRPTAVAASPRIVITHNAAKYVLSNRRQAELPATWVDHAICFNISVVTTESVGAYLKYIIYCVSGGQIIFNFKTLILFWSKTMSRQLSGPIHTWLFRQQVVLDHVVQAEKWNKCCFRTWFCILRVYWAGMNLD